MPDIRIEFETEDKTDLEQKAQDLQEQLKQLGVKNAEAMHSDDRMTGLEIVGLISVAIAVTGKTRELVAELRKLVPELKKLAKTMGFSKATVKLGRRRLPLAEVEKLSDTELEHAASA